MSLARRSAVIAVVTACSLVVSAGTALAALPRTYQVQRVDSPVPSVGGDFGIALVNGGDLNADGKDDVVVGTDEHGGSTGQIFVMSGADGSHLRTVNAPDTAGDTGTLTSFGSFVGKLPDIASCAGGTSGAQCPNNPSGGPDGRPEILVSALGVDVGGLQDAGRAYVVDGATGAILKRLQMPAADLADQSAAPGGPKKPAFGRTILNPSSQFGPTGPSGPGTPPTAVQIGDLNGGGKPDIVVGASDYFETGATAHPDSDCASAPGNECLQAGREYVFYGETIAPAASGTDPTAIEDTPDLTIKNPAAQADDLTTPVNGNRESMGYSIAPVGDVGRCTTNPGPGSFCPNANSTGTADGKPDIALSSHRTDDFGMFDAGVVHLIDGSTGAVLYTYRHPEPQPASLFGFSNYNQPAVGDLGSSTTPDVYEPAMRQNNPYTGGGKGYGMNGAFKQSGSPNSISFATFVDPTPNPSEDFGTSSAGIGNVVGTADGLDGRTEVLIGAYGPHNPGTNSNVINDIHIMSALSERPLQTIQAPDQQPGGGFGTALAPMGDLNGDGFLDFAVGAGLLDVGGNGDQGRIYLLRSDNSPAPPAPDTTPPAGPQGSPGQQGPPGTVQAAPTLAGRTVELSADSNSIRRGRRTVLRGLLDAFADEESCVAGQSVRVQRRTGNRRYATFATKTVKSNGIFSLRVRPSATTRYRALVVQTDKCLAAASGPEIVKVVKPKAKSARRR